ncbi:hypothetical protein ACTJKO_10395 [Curtobacterium sp. 22159]|uniref:hypothetical protein n=1 Tax=Curtobacterium sp. 22159 TaxID=3453882 RepID=UPI003F826678
MERSSPTARPAAPGDTAHDSMIRIVEWCPRWLVLGMALVLLGVDLFVAWMVRPGGPETGDASALPILVLVSAIVMTFAAAPQTLVITDERIRMRALYFVDVRISRREVADVIVVDVRAGAFGGIGVRAANGGLAFVSGSKPAIRLRTRSGREYVFTTEDARTVAARLEDVRDGRG